MSTITDLNESAPRRAADRILAAAREVFYRVGIRAVGVEDVVRRAGATKPSLYRAFGSKDELVAAYLAEENICFWTRFDAAMEAHPGDPEAQILAFLAGLARRAAQPDFRGCGLVNAAMEYPEPGHPAHDIPVASKIELRRRLRQLARDMGASEPDALGDGLFLLIEGAYASVHVFGSAGPALSIAAQGDRLIQSHLPR